MPRRWVKCCSLWPVTLKVICIPFWKSAHAKKLLLIVVTSDRGLCGGFNSNLCKAGERYIKEKQAEFEQISIMTVGRKGYEFLKNRHTVYKNFSNILSKPNYQTAAMLAQDVIEGYLAQKSMIRL
jgi:F-type H+-transporting ATPase subunit gamma